MLRTPEALQCLAAITEAVPGAITGAGTVLNSDQAQSAVSVGAGFIVSPGLDQGVVNIANENDIRVYPGVVTATEVQRAWNMGLRALKFFPASLAVGRPMLKSLAAVFRDMSFMPTGGISPLNLTPHAVIVLANYGLRSSFVSALPDNPVGETAIRKSHSSNLSLISVMQEAPLPLRASLECNTPIAAIHDCAGIVRNFAGSDTVFAKLLHQCRNPVGRTIEALS